MNYPTFEKKVFFSLDEKMTGNTANDIRRKLPYLADTAQKVVAQYAKIYRSFACDVTDTDTHIILPDDIYHVEYAVDEQGAYVLGFREHADNTVTFSAPGTYTLWYSKIPDAVPTENNENYVFELQDLACEIMILGVCASIQRMEYDLRYFTNFFTEYQGMLQNLNPRLFGAVIVTGGEDYGI